MRSIVIAMCLVLAACSDEALPPLTATDVVVNEPIPGMSMTSAYMSLRNNSATELQITRVSSPNFGTVEIHSSSIEDGVAKMREIETLIIPPDSSLVLQPGGTHLMLMRRVEARDTVELHFYSGEAVLLSLVTALTPRSN